jgi:toxin YoeB
MEYWKTHDVRLLQKIETLIADICNHPFTGIGKPEPLKFQFSGYWSRRINKTHRLVYKVHEDTVYIVQCRYHY